MNLSDRLKKLPPYLFVEIDRAKKKARQEGKDIIDLGVGDPDQPTPRFIIDALHSATLNPETHRYALERGLPQLRIEIARWYKSRFNVDLDPDREILPLIGSKEGISHIPLAFINQGDVGLVPDPCYPPYNSSIIFAGGQPCNLPLLEKNSFLPDLHHVKPHILNKAKMLFLNYPNNPTAAVCDKSFFKDVVKFAGRHNIIVCHDAAYSELSFDGLKIPSFLETGGAKEVGVEFHSFSKIFNMTGWRLGFVSGNSKVIEALTRVKSNIDSGVFNAIQVAGVEAIKRVDRVSKSIKGLYQRRRNIFVDGLNKIGWEVAKPRATFYVWARVFGRYTSATLAKELLDKAGVIVTPGNGFGSSGEGYVRMALTVGEQSLRKAVDRIRKVICE
ncbi:MAG: LL-diaminopimelate aminotransferase [Candidatus Omnitrophota bacterium]|nr:MAG: LL-diaminopimelate aminotransferase [Candidatus Omnitrophota bacterium]